MVENMIHIDAERLNRQYFYRGIKRLFDVVASSIGVVVDQSGTVNHCNLHQS